MILEVGWAEKVRRRKKKKRNTKGKPTVYIIIKNFAVVLECVNNWSRGLFPAAANRKMRHNWHDKSFDHMGPAGVANVVKIKKIPVFELAVGQ